MQDYNAQVVTGKQKNCRSLLEPGLGKIGDQMEKYVYIYCFYQFTKRKITLLCGVTTFSPSCQNQVPKKGFGRIVSSCVINQLHQTGEKHIKLISLQLRKTSKGFIGLELAESGVTQVRSSAVGRGLARTGRHGRATAKKVITSA